MRSLEFPERRRPSTSSGRTSHSQPRKSSDIAAATSDLPGGTENPTKSSNFGRTTVAMAASGVHTNTASGPSTTSSANMTPSSHPPVSDSKRRSMIRSTGTASSPDLAQLSRRQSKDGNGDAAEATTLHVNHVDRAAEQPSSRSSHVQGPSTATVTSNQRDRAASYANNGRPIPTSISHSQGMSRITTATPPQVEDMVVHKTMRSRARGMFGRMFGTKEPPVSAGMQNLSNNGPSSPSSRAVSSSAPSHPRRSSADVWNRSVTPTQGVLGPIRRDSNDRQSAARIDKPLPSLIGSVSDRPRSNDADTLKAKTHHSRQPAASGDEEILSTPSKRPMETLTPSITHSDSSSPGKQIREWTRDVEGMLEGDGIEANLAQELGLPLESVSSLQSGKKRSPAPTEKQAPNYGVLESPYLPGPKYTPRTTSLPTEHRTLSPIMGRATSSPAGSGVCLEPTASSHHISASHPAAEDVGSNSQSEVSSELLEASPNGDIRRGGAMDGPTARLVAPTNPHDSPIRWRLQSASDVRLADTVSSPHFGRSPAWGAITTSNRRKLSPTATPITCDEPETTPSDNDALDEEGRRMACEFLEDDETHVAHDRVAEYLGGIRPLSKYALKHYMAYFDFSGVRVDEAFRQFCRKLYLKAETQEIDRILDGFSARYFQCNPTTIFVSPTVIHVVTGSFLLLNTDLHIADIAQHMSRNQFVKLTLDTIYANVQPPSERSSTPELIGDDSSSTTHVASDGRVPPPNNASRSVSRTQSVYSTVSGKDSLQAPNAGGATTPGQEPRSRLGSSTSLGSSLFNKAWEVEVEAALKDIFSAVKSQQILLPVNNVVAPLGGLYSPLSASQTIRRKSSQRNTSNGSTDRVYSLKRGSVRGIQGLLSASPYGPSHLTMDGHISPTPSCATSIGEGFLSSSHLAAPSLGFASNLSHTVIKEQEDENLSTVSGISDGTLDDLNDDELALLGAPWAKEGTLSRKTYWDAPNKRSKEKTWKQEFVVIQKGDLHMFTFGEGSSRSPAGAAVGGGNWMTNARGQGEMNLSHSLASALPPPGYNASRPHCFSLTLPGGEMSFFQAGTEDLVQEWVATCNYWAARRSRPPLPGGLGNVEYGWNRLLEVGAESPSTRPDDAMSMKSNRSGRSRASFQASMGRRNLSSSMVERMHIAEWRAPQASLIPSPLDEETQLESLQKYVQSLKTELEQHAMLEEPMSKMFLTRTSNSIKAKDNWRNKSLFIHSEIVKYETYVEALKSAISLGLKKQGERKLERSLAHRHVEVDEEDGVMGKNRQRQRSVNPVAE